MYNYSIMPLDIEHIDEICADVERQYKDKISDCVLFMFKIVPEGIPTIDKAKIQCEKYRLFRDRLAEKGIECGILVQCTIGHGYALNENASFQPVIAFSDGAEKSTYCPYDEGIREYFFNQFATIAKENPKVIMVDDDFRLMFRPSEACACPLHLKRLEEVSGEKFTRETLRKRIYDDKDKRILELYNKTQGESLIDAAKAMRAGIDSVDPSIQGVFCICGIYTEYGAEIEEALAGEGNPKILRINNGRYCSPGARDFSGIMYRAALQMEVLKGKVDIYLAETDTCPQNRYSTGAYPLHSHFTASIIEGCSGAKHWITRLAAFEPKSGEAFRKVLGKHAGFYDALSKLVPKLNHIGCRIPLYNYQRMLLGTGSGSKLNCWHDHILERFGIPIYFAHDFGGALFLGGDDDEIYSDSELLEQLSGTIFIESYTAEKLCKRGFSKYLGVEIKEFGGKKSGEILHINGNKVNSQIGTREIVPLTDSVKWESTVFFLKNGKDRIPLFPGVSSFKNELGGTVYVFCGTPETKFWYTEAFSFLNESRKLQFVDLLKRTGNLPVYYKGDEEVLLRAANIEGTDELFCTVFNIGLDPIEEIELAVEKDVKQVEMLDCSGERVVVDFIKTEDGIIVKKSANTHMPVILFLK